MVLCIGRFTTLLFIYKFSGRSMTEFNDKEAVDTFIKSLKFSDTNKCVKVDLERIKEILDKKIKYTQLLFDNLVKLQTSRKTSRKTLNELEKECLECVRSVKKITEEYLNMVRSSLAELSKNKKEISKFFEDLD